MTYVILGLCVAVAGFIKVSRFSTINYSVVAKDIEMDAILAVALGGNALSCGMSLVMITGGIDISVGTLTALVCMSCAVNLDFLLIHHCMDSPVHILTILHIQNNIRLLRVCFHFHAVQLQNTFLLLLCLRLLLRGFLLKKIK